MIPRGCEDECKFGTAIADLAAAIRGRHTQNKLTSKIVEVPLTSMPNDMNVCEMMAG